MDFPPPYPLSDSDSDTEGSTGPPVDGRVVLLSDSDTEGGGRPAGPPGDVVVLLSDSASEDSCSEGGTANAGFLNKQNGKLPMVSEHPFAERQDRHVFGDALSRLLEVFPGVCRDTAAADLSSQLKTASPETALDEIVGRYLGQGVPMAETVPQEKPKPGTMNPRIMVHVSDAGDRNKDSGYSTFVESLTNPMRSGRILRLLKITCVAASDCLFLFPSSELCLRSCRRSPASHWASHEETGKEE